MVVNLDIYSGLLGAGKTTLINKMLGTAYTDHKVAIVENEIGKINLDSGEFQNTSIKVEELTSGCVCCTLRGNLTRAIALLVRQEQPEYIIIEPTGLADLSGVIQACLNVPGIVLNRCIMVVNSKKNNTLMKVVGKFYTEQLKTAGIIYLNFTEKMCSNDVMETKEILHSINPTAKLIDTPISEITKDTFATDKYIPCCGTENPNSDVLSSGGKAAGAIKRKKRTIAVEEVGGETPVHMLTGNQTKIYTWSYSFQKEMSEENIMRLKEILSDTGHCDIWRAKGYLKMQNGTVCKFDTVFGEIFEEIRIDLDETKTGTLVLIGKKLDSKWLEAQFEELKRI